MLFVWRAFLFSLRESGLYFADRLRIETGLSEMTNAIYDIHLLACKNHNIFVKRELPDLKYTTMEKRVPLVKEDEKEALLWPEISHIIIQ